MRTLLRMAVNTMLPMGWPTRATTPPASSQLSGECNWARWKFEACAWTENWNGIFNMVPQPEVLKIRVGNENHIVLRNLSGQRQGARSWYWHLHKCLDEAFKVEWCLEQPCLCRNNNSCLLTHVDDILHCGFRQFWNDVFFPTFQKSFTMSYRLSHVGRSWQ